MDREHRSLLVKPVALRDRTGGCHSQHWAGPGNKRSGNSAWRRIGRGQRIAGWLRIVTNVEPGGSRGPAIERADFTTAQSLDAPVSPDVSAQDDFFKFLFQHQDLNYDDLKEKAGSREPLAPFSLKGYHHHY